MNFDMKYTNNKVKSENVWAPYGQNWEKRMMISLIFKGT